MSKENYQPFGTEWQKEMNKLPKSMLIQIASKLGKEKEASKYEGVLLGLKICKEMFAQGQISHENIYENEIYYKELLESKLPNH